MAIRLEPPATTHLAEAGEHRPRPSRDAAPDPDGRRPDGTLPPSADPDYEGPPSIERRRVTCTLLPRHAEWLEAAARREGRTIEAKLEALVREACARDPLRLVDTRPPAPGFPAGTGRR